jgi:hypothetical protein
MNGMSLGQSIRARLAKLVFPVGLVTAGLLVLGSHVGCGSGNGGSLFGDGGGIIGSSNGSNGGSSGSFSSSSSGNSGSSSGSGTVPCPQGLQCNVSCSGSSTTSISGIVYDPAGKDPLYNIAVYVPGGPLQPLPAGVPTGADACTCGALFKSGMVVQTATGVDGSFKLLNAPVGNVPLVIQVGKWRRQFMVQTTACMDTALPNKMLTLPGTVPAGDTNTSMPQISVTTGSADTLECLMLRIGLPPSEYVAGPGGSGHVHLYAGGNPSGGGGMGGPGRPEMGTIGALPAADTNLWDSQAHMMPYDITLLSCEGGETYDAKPQNLENYLNAGGRVFASHYHYAWFTNPVESMQSYTPPADWGNNLASWTPGSNTTANGMASGKIVQTLNGSTAPFPKGVAFYKWLGLNGALGVLGAPMGELPINPVRYNSVVGPTNKPSQPWVQDDMSPNTLYFSFDTPVNAPAAPDGGAPQYCGRAVFSDLHVGGETMPPDQDPAMSRPSPVNAGGCAMADLSPQEKALEFMLFDLSSCVIPDYTPPQTDGGIVQ